MSVVSPGLMSRGSPRRAAGGPAGTARVAKSARTARLARSAGSIRVAEAAASARVAGSAGRHGSAGGHARPARVAEAAGSHRVAGPVAARPWRSLLEERRTLLEARALLRHPVWRGAAVARGDGLPVLLIPGFEVVPEHLSFTFLSRWLSRIGYVSYRSKVRLDADRTQGAADRLERRLRLLADLARRPVALIGHGKGGQLAKDVAIRRPDLVAGLISLGTPHLVSAQPPEHQQPAQPFPSDVPFTAIYSRSDGVVPWRACLDPDAESVEVRCSHVGMVVHPTVYRLVGERLAAMAARRRRPDE